MLGAHGRWSDAERRGFWDRHKPRTATAYFRSLRAGDHPTFGRRDWDRAVADRPAGRRHEGPHHRGKPFRPGRDIHRAVAATPQPGIAEENATFCEQKATKKLC